MPLACKYCVLIHEIKGIPKPGLFSTDEELFKHMESEHGVVVRRDGETDQEAIERFNLTYGARHIPRLEYRKIKADSIEHHIWDTQSDYSVVELIGSQMEKLGPSVAMILDWLGVRAQLPKALVKSHCLKQSKKGMQRSKKRH